MNTERVRDLVLKTLNRRKDGLLTILSIIDGCEASQREAVLQLKQEGREHIIPHHRYWEELLEMTERELSIVLAEIETWSTCHDMIVSHWDSRFFPTENPEES